MAKSQPKGLPADTDDFTKAELDELFQNKRPKLRRRLDRTAMARSDAPFLTDPKDAGIKKRTKINYNPKRNSVKVLTILKPARIIPVTIKRKDGKMAAKSKIQINYTQRVAVCLLAGGAVLGFADQLGGGLKACVVAAMLVGCLFVMAIDFDK